MICYVCKKNKENSKMGVGIVKGPKVLTILRSLAMNDSFTSVKYVKTVVLVS